MVVSEQCGRKFDARLGDNGAAGVGRMQECYDDVARAAHCHWSVGGGIVDQADRSC